MRCYYHPSVDAIGTCAHCGKAICQEDAIDVAGRLYCRADVASGDRIQLGSQQSRPTNTLAIVSLVLGILGLCGGVFFAVPAWILGSMAMKQIAENPGQDGQQLASTGRLMGIIFTVIYSALIGFYLLFLMGTGVLSLLNQ